MILLDLSLLNSFIFFAPFGRFQSPCTFGPEWVPAQDSRVSLSQSTTGLVPAMMALPMLWRCLDLPRFWRGETLQKKTNGFHFRNRFVLYLDFLTCQVWRLCVLNYGVLGAVPASCLQGWGTNTLFHFVSWC